MDERLTDREVMERLDSVRRQLADLDELRSELIEDALTRASIPVNDVATASGFTRATFYRRHRPPAHSTG